jgi:hypothetical protein
VRPGAAAGLATGLGVVAVAGMTVLGGVAPEWAVLLGLPFTAFMLLFLLAPGGVEAIWAPLPDPATRPSEHLATSLESRLSEAADYQPRFRSRVQPRLARLAMAKLRRNGIDELHDPRAPEVLSAQLHRLVTDPDATMPDPKTAAAIFATLEES